MQIRHMVLGLALVVLMLSSFTPHALQAQEERHVTDFRERESYTPEELGAALFPTLQTRGVFLRAAQSPPAALLRPSSVVIPVFFPVNSAEILPQYYGELDKLGAQLTATHYQTYSVRIEGHSDSLGAALLNQRLSERRAESVKHYLVQRFTIASERLATQGYGPQRPLASNATEAGRRKNRRIEIANVVQ